MDLIIYLFWPNPGNATYESPKAMALLILCAVMVAGALALKFWRKSLKNGVTRKLSRSWPAASFWFGLIGLILVVCRVEGISYLSMRFLWVIWGLSLLLYLYLQIRLFRARHYEVLPRDDQKDPRLKYLPKKK